MFNYNTDLALERSNIFKNKNNLNEIPGIETKSIDEGKYIKTNIVNITNKDGEEAIGKPIGTYITIDVKNLKIADENDIEEASKVVTKELKKLIDKHVKRKEDILVVGLGNEYVTPDSLRTKGCFRD